MYHKRSLSLLLLLCFLVCSLTNSYCLISVFEKRNKCSCLVHNRSICWMMRDRIILNLLFWSSSFFLFEHISNICSIFCFLSLFVIPTKKRKRHRKKFSTVQGREREQKSPLTTKTHARTHKQNIIVRWMCHLDHFLK